MNLVLFDAQEIGSPLPATDARARHLREVLRIPAGGTFDAGIVNGARGRATLRSDDIDALTFDFEPGPPLAPLPPTQLLIGLPRPQSARDILRDATTLGATLLQFVQTERTDPNYATSSLWRSGDWQRCLRAGASQAFDPRLPEVRWQEALPDALAAIAPPAARYALDNYEAEAPLAGRPMTSAQTVVLAVGPERGWGAGDRRLLRASGFQLVHLGPRVLRLETAVVAALTLVAANRGPV